MPKQKIVDDILLVGQSKQDLLAKMEMVLKKARSLNVSISREKLQFGKKVVVRSLTEKRYAPIEIEALAIAYAMEKCRIFLKGGPKFEVWTDHKPLESIFRKHYTEVTNPRVKRFMEKTIDGFDYEVKWVEGKSHEIADALSRYPVNNDIEETGQINSLENAESNNNNKVPIIAVTTVYTKSLEKIVEIANNDPKYQEMVCQILSGEKPKKWNYGYNFKNNWNNLSIEDRLIILDNSRIVISTNYQNEILKLVHMGHPGETRMKKIVKSLYYLIDVERIICLRFLSIITKLIIIIYLQSDLKIRIYIDGNFENTGTIINTRDFGQSYVIRLDDGRTFIRNKKFLRKFHGNKKNETGTVANDKKKVPSNLVA